MENIFSSILFGKGGKENAAEPDPVKYFAVVHVGQGRMQVVIEDTHSALTALLRRFCQEPNDVEAMGTCNKQGVIDMTNPDKFQKKWLNGKITAQLRTFRDLFRKQPESADALMQDR